MGYIRVITTTNPLSLKFLQGKAFNKTIEGGTSWPKGHWPLPCGRWKCCWVKWCLEKSMAQPGRLKTRGRFMILDACFLRVLRKCRFHMLHVHRSDFCWLPTIYVQVFSQYMHSWNQWWSNPNFGSFLRMFNDNLANCVSLKTFKSNLPKKTPGTPSVLFF